MPVAPPKSLCLAIAFQSCLVLGLLAAASTAGAAPLGPSGDDRITVTLTFGPDDLAVLPFGPYALVELKGADLPEDEPGTPWLPAKFVSVLVPSGAVVTDVTASVSETLVRENILVAPAQPPSPKSQPPSPFVPPSAAAYASAAKTPAQAAVLGRTHVMRGHSLASVRVNPVRYVPSTKQLFLATRLELTVAYRRPGLALMAHPRHADRFRRAVNRLVVNPGLAGADPAYRPTAGSAPSTDGSLTLAAEPPADQVDYLIITNGTLAAGFQALADHRASHDGLSTQVVTTDWIYANYPGDKPSGGSDNQTRIRNCIADYVANKGTLYVVLGGDDGPVPDRDCYVTCGSYTESHMPTDLYYSDLDGTWDADADGTYGEASYDGVDLLPDVIVGRIPVSSTTHVAAYVNKVIAFETGAAPGNLATKMMQCGHKLWDKYSAGDSGYPSDAEFQDRVPYGGSVSDAEIWMVRNFRVYIQPYWQPGTRGELYDTASTWDSTPQRGDYAESPANLVTRFNEGWNHVAYDTHGNATVWAAEGGNFGTSHASSLTNLTVVVQTGACLTGKFDGATSLSEAFIRNANGGALAYLGCSRYGWGSPGSYYGGSSWRYMREFYTQVFRYGITDLGEAFATHKAAIAPSSMWNGSYRWIQFGLNLQGDPGLYIHGVKPEVSIQATDPYAAEPGADTGAFTVTRTGDQGNLTVSYTVTGTATPGDDYTTLAGEVVIPDGSDSATMLVSPADDPDAETDETVIVTLDPSDDYQVGAPDEATVTIVDDDSSATPVVEIVATDPDAAEPDDPGEFALVRTGSAAADLDVHLSIGGSAAPGDDYAALVLPVTIPAGQTSATVAVDPVDDSLVEGAETVVATLDADPAYTIAGSGQATVDLADDEDPHAVTVTATDPDASEVGPDSGAFAVHRTGDTTLPLEVSFYVQGSAQNGTDYAALTSPVTIGAGQSDALLLVNPVDDADFEGPETVTLTVQANAGWPYVVSWPASATVTITDSENTVSIAATDAQASEPGADTGTFTVSRDGDTTDAMTVHYTVGGTADGGADYQALSLQVTIPAHQSAATILVTPLDDPDHEAPETVVVTLADDPAYRVDPRDYSATVTIDDDDNDAPLVAITDPADGAEIEAGADLVIDADASDDDGIDKVEFFVDGEKLGEDGSSPYSVTWPAVPVGDYTLTALAWDTLGLSAVSAPVSIQVRLGALPPPWEHADVGAVAAAGDAGYASASETFTAIGSGNDIWGEADEFHFIYQSVSGDGEISARVLSLENTNSWAKAGVMIRDSLDTAAKHAMTVVTPGNGVSFQRRTATGGTSTSTKISGIQAPHWVKIRREGDTVLSYHSDDGLAWTQVGTDTVQMGDTVYVGLPVTSHSDGTLCTATFDHVVVDFNVPPTVAITHPADGARLAAGIDVAVSAAASDPDGTVTQVEFFLDGASLGVDTAAPFSVPWEDLALGTYVLTATATDDDGETADADPVTVTVSLGGDTDLDGDVDASDLATLGVQWKPSATDRAWADGDFDGDGDVDATDLVILSVNWNPSGAGQAAPEPAAEAPAPADVGGPHVAGASPDTPRVIATVPAPGSATAGLREIVVRFDRPVRIGGGAVEVHGLATGAAPACTITCDPDACTLRLAWPEALPGDVYDIRLLADAVVDSETGAPLDGEVADPADPALPSGDGLPGGDCVLEFEAR